MSTPITRKWIQQSLLGMNLGAQTAPAGGTTGDDRDGDAINGGKFRHFGGGSIYWHPSLGAHEVHGSILAQYRTMGFERSALGFPLSDERPGFRHVNNRFNEFENGVLYWHSTTNNVDVIAPVSIPHTLVEIAVTTVIQNALRSAMTGGIRPTVDAIRARIASVLPNEYMQRDYPHGGQQLDIFTHRRLRITFSFPFTGAQNGTLNCEIKVEFRVNALGKLVFVLRDFDAGFADPGQQILSALLCIGGRIDEQVTPMCNIEMPVPLAGLPVIPAGSVFLAAHINTPSIGRGNPHDLLLYIEPVTP